MGQSKLDATVRQVVMLLGTFLMMLKPHVFTDTIVASGSDIAIATLGVVMEIIAFVGTLRSKAKAGIQSVASWAKALSNTILMK